MRQLALSGPCREDVLRSFHDTHAGGGHLGVQQTIAAICERYFFPGMYQIIGDYVTTCDLCQRMKVDRKTSTSTPPPPPHPPLTPMPVPDVFTRWHMNILGPLPKADGFQYILLGLIVFLSGVRHFLWKHRMQNRSPQFCIMRSLLAMGLHPFW